MQVTGRPRDAWPVPGQPGVWEVYECGACGDGGQALRVMGELRCSACSALTTRIDTIMVPVAVLLEDG